MKFRCIRPTFFLGRMWEPGGPALSLPHDVTVPPPGGGKPINRHFVRVAGEDPPAVVLGISINTLLDDQLDILLMDEGIIVPEAGLTRDEKISAIGATRELPSDYFDSRIDATLPPPASPVSIKDLTVKQLDELLEEAKIEPPAGLTKEEKVLLLGEDKTVPAERFKKK